MKIHFVKQGDTLYEISQKYGVELDALIAANPQLKDPDKLMPGMKIKVPTKAAALIVQPTPEVTPNPAVEAPEMVNAPTVELPVNEKIAMQEETEVNKKVVANAPVKDLFKYDHIPAVPAAGSLYELPQAEAQQEAPWGMPYPQSNQYFPVSKEPCGCGGSGDVTPNQAYAAANGWPTPIPYSNWLPYAQPFQQMMAPTPAVSPHGASFPEYPAPAKGRSSEGKVKATTSQADAVNADKGKKSTKRSRKRSNPAVAKIRKLTASKGKSRINKHDSLPWINR